MSLAITCSGHNLLPGFDNFSFGKTSYKVLPPIKTINSNLSKLPSQGGKLVEIAIIASMTFLSIFKVIAVAATPGLITLAGIGCLTLLIKILNFKDYKDEVKKIINEIDAIFKEYTKEFIYTERKTESLIQLSEEDFKNIKHLSSEMVNPLPLLIREEMHYRLTGGEIGMRSALPLRLEKVCEKDNKQKVIDTYKPWVDLLVTLAKEGISEDFLNLVGRMGGLNIALSRFAIIEVDHLKISCEFNSDEKGKHILCKEETGKVVIIRTIEECRDFVKKNLKLNNNLQ